jgi:hypothetical protein
MEVFDMEKLKKEIVEWMEWLKEDINKTLKEELEKGVQVLLDTLWDKGVLKEKPEICEKNNGG